MNASYMTDYLSLNRLAIFTLECIYLIIGYLAILSAFTADGYARIKGAGGNCDRH